MLKEEVHDLEVNFELARKANAGGANTLSLRTRDMVTNLGIEAAEGAEKRLLVKNKALYGQNRQLKAQVAKLDFEVSKVRARRV